MSDWIWRMILLKSAFLTLTCNISYLRADDVVQKLPFCNPSNAKDAPAYNDLVIISTLDGRVTAFSTQNGNKAWDLETQPLLSSNLHHVELTAGGKWVRLVPSLRGSLYSLSGDTIEPLPFDAEQLLSSSFKYSDDLVIAGARETLWVGVDANTGGVVYECGSSGCNNEQQTAGASRDVLVLRRHSNTVRALDPRNGNEKWNFSVAEHQLAMNRRECVGGTGPRPAAPVHVTVALHDGVVAIRTPEGRQLMWQRKLEAPVAGMWRLHEGSLQHIDVLWEATQSIVEGGITQHPSLYIGVHDTQLYIQESQYYSRKIETAVATKPLPWKLVTARPLITDSTGETALTVQDTDTTLSLVTLYGNGGLAGDHGFFLYLQETCDQAVQVTEDALDAEAAPNNSQDNSHHHIHVHVYSLWFWWKEVLLIAVSSALLLNLMIWPRFFAPKVRPTTPLPLNQEYIVVERHYERPPSVPEYSGRYENDFTPLRCLGRGGFGVVFEAKNNIDHCSYAIKRITLSNQEQKRERVLREVRALAQLDHENIVRYFNAWLEHPPPNWQRRHDQQWMRQLEGVSVLMSESCSAASPAPHGCGSVRLDLQKCDECVDALEFDNKMSEPKRSRSCNESFSIVFDENASSPHLSSKTPTKQLTDDGLPNTLSKRATTDDDSFIVFANPDELSKHSASLSVPGQYSGSGLSEAKKNSSFDKRLERVKQADYKTGSSSGKKKKGHTRHWSLDMVVRESVRSRDDEPRMFLYIQMQLCCRDSLHDWLRNNRTRDTRAHHVKNLFRQIVCAVEYVHLAGLIHRDLKPSNILFAPDGRVKVGDFGLVTSMADASGDSGAADCQHCPEQRHTYRVGTHLYMSPEQLQGRPYSYKVDIYSLGLILYELLQPFGTESERVTCLLKLRNHMELSDEFRSHYPSETEVLKLMLSEEPGRRPTASGVRARAPLLEQTDERYHFTLPSMAAVA
ncbi:eukaryotic translation initiation factor 2-alpha kinase isoform X2 [Manduca sexta]|uniref:eukaryotic translation initiation factor 2-alpha kinase isoform X2 n=1 Tax=Manduca sexta TaxID=7130 RepID=UPI0011829FD5|nr:eukaryotic translation initiation factor 2-alpha kinase isoform X2 [Manduca sexta]